MRLLFIGTGEIGVPSLRRLLAEHEVAAVVTQPDKPVGRAQTVTGSPIKTVALENGIPVLQPTRIKAPDAVEQIASFAPDVIVVAAYGQILPRTVLAIPRVACLNIHASLLPRWRGASPIQAAIRAGDAESGITIMYMDEGLDTGDVLMQQHVEIASDETGDSLHDKLAEIAPDALDGALSLLTNGNAPRFPQNNSDATSASKLEREDGRIDWNDAALDIERMIRAYDPWPTAFTMIYDEAAVPRKLKIFRARVADCESRPGSIIRMDDEIIAGTSRCALSLLQVQLEGKRRMSAAEFASGWRAPLRLMH